MCPAGVSFAPPDHRVAVQRRQGPPSGGFRPPPAPPLLPAAAAAAGIGRASCLGVSPSVTLVSVRPCLCRCCPASCRSSGSCSSLLTLPDSRWWPRASCSSCRSACGSVLLPGLNCLHLSTDRPSFLPPSPCRGSSPTFPCFPGACWTFSWFLPPSSWAAMSATLRRSLQ